MMSKRLPLASALLLTTCLFASPAFAQASGSNTPTTGAPGATPSSPSGNPTQDEAETSAAPQVSIPGGSESR